MAPFRHLSRSIASRVSPLAFLLLLLTFVPVLCPAQDLPYFITYSHNMEEPGNLEFEFETVTGKPQSGNRFFGSAVEMEYGVKGWWTTEFYLDGQTTANDSTIFTGFRWENRFRPLMREHWINPVLYVEFENVNGADRTLREVVGHDGKEDFLESNAVTRAEREREFELKLILSSNFRGWNVSENIIAVKNITNEPWEFGYALGASRPLKLAASAHDCTFCAEKIVAGVEMYGGLGDAHSLGLNQTSHYIGPAISWDSPAGMTFSFSPQFGMNDHSLPHLYRFGVSYEIDQVFNHFRERGGRK